MAPTHARRTNKKYFFLFSNLSFYYYSSPINPEWAAKSTSKAFSNLLSSSLWNSNFRLQISQTQERGLFRNGLYMQMYWNDCPFKDHGKPSKLFSLRGLKTIGRIWDEHLIIQDLESRESDPAVYQTPRNPIPEGFGTFLDWILRGVWGDPSGSDSARFEIREIRFPGSRTSWTDFRIQVSQK
jgi:hypothetical protein